MAGCGTQIDSGYKGVKYYKFGDGTQMGKVYNEGFQWHLPWNSFYTYKVQVNEAKEKLHILAVNGVSLDIDMGVWFYPDVSKLDSLQITVGPDYANSVVLPALREESRKKVGKYTPEDTYSAKRDLIGEEILAGMRELCGKKFIIVDKILIRDVNLPEKIKAAIDAKITADQEQQQMEFTLLKEAKEAERKRIEAGGIADFQRIVSQGITPSLLEWKGIEATEKLVASPNAKIIVIGNGKDNLPVLLNGGN
jgi:regulator of protease activity HflC (stomatin/prohibitin superfamily)